MKLGDRVTFTARLVRENHGRNASWDRLECKPTTGFLIGYRTLTNGRRNYDENYGITYEPTEYINVALVAFSLPMNRSPAYVGLDDIRKEGE